MSPELNGKLESLVNRPLRNIGGCVGFSLPLEALEETGIVDKNGEIISDETSVRILIYDDDDQDGARLEARINK